MKALFVVLLLLVTASVQATHARIVIVAGQSNAYGAMMPEADFRARFCSSDYHSVFDANCVNRSILYRFAVNKPFGSEVLVSTGESTAYTPFTGFQDGVKYLNVGPEMTFVDHLELNTKHRLVLLKVAFSGTSIDQWYTHLAQHLVDQLKHVVSELHVKDYESVEVEALVWVQGESDIGAGTSLASYVQKFNSILDRVRAVAPVETSDMQVLMTRSSFFAGFPGNSCQIRAAQQQISRHGVNTDIVDTDSLIKPDGAHYSVSGYMTLGNQIYSSLHHDVKNLYDEHCNADGTPR